MRESSVFMRCVLAVLCFVVALPIFAAGGYTKVKRDYTAVIAPPAPEFQSQVDVVAKSEGCQSCHGSTDSHNMHATPAVRLGCTDCHGGNAEIKLPQGVGLDSELAAQLLEKAHVLPQYPEAWHFPHSENPERSYTLLNIESPEFIRFVNPGDLRIADESCGACHQAIIEASKRSLHATGTMFWGGASYNNNILPFKRYILGESYTRDGKPMVLKGPVKATPYMQSMGIIDEIWPLPAWETVAPGDIFRVFERGGRNIINLFPETGIPNSLGLIQRLEEPGRPDFRQSNRGPGTGARISVPLINVTKTRLNDPMLWFLGTNDQPGDYRSSGCTGCHVVYANDRDPVHSGPYAKLGNDGKSQQVDPTISKQKSGHPIKHQFSRAVPTSQCMVCHMHQPNMFMNSYMGYTMWDYESDAPTMWPEEQRYPDHAERRKILDRNPEGAAVIGKWGDPEFLKEVSKLNAGLTDTQFADYHGHGWNFRAVFKRDRKGQLLDKKGDAVSDQDPDKFKKAVHMRSIHAEVGMHCVDCHFSQDAHGNGHIYGEVAQAVEIACIDCHGTADKYPNLKTSGPAALDGGADLSLLRNPDGKRRFEWVGDKLIQRSVVNPGMEWTLSLVKDSVTRGTSSYNAKAARAKLMAKDTAEQNWPVDAKDAAHGYEEMECYACHTSWTPSCGGCHLPIEANEKTERHHYEGGETRNFATYNPQVARSQIFILGKRAPYKGAKVAPVRSSSALVLSSTNANRERIYIQQPPLAASGYSSQAFNPHFPHTARKEETRVCSDCHLSENGDNNSIVGQTLGLGTNFVNFVGRFAWLGEEDHIEAVAVTEWSEPQAVYGSYLQKYAYPDYFKNHQANDSQLQTAHAHRAGQTQCLQMRGEFLFAADGGSGFRVYDIASIDNKGISQKIISAPFSDLGNRANVKTKDISCVALPTTQPVAPERNQGDLMRIENMEQPFHPLYHYVFITDRKEGLILVNIDTFADGEPRNNSLKRALTWNPDGLLDDARHVSVAGHYLYITTPEAVRVINIDEPLKPRLAATLPFDDARATAVQFRYLWVTDRNGVNLVDITKPEQPRFIPSATIAVSDARKMHLARTYAYVAAGAEGLVIIDIEKPESMKLYQRFNAEGQIRDAQDVVVASTNASLFAYVADGKYGLKVLQLTSPKTQPKFYGYSPEPKPELIAARKTKSAALSLSRPLERDRAVDENGGQIAVFGRRGSRPFTGEEMRRLYLDDKGKPWTVSDEPK